MIEHWTKKYLKKRWTEEYNCFSHFCDVQENEYGVDSFDKLTGIENLKGMEDCVRYINEDETFNRFWEKVDHPKDGDAVFFQGGTIDFHVGTFVELDTGGILHCKINRGVMFTRWRTFKQLGIGGFIIMRNRGRS